MLFCCVFCFFCCCLFLFCQRISEKKEKKISFLKYINQSACIEIEGLEDDFFFFFFDGLALHKQKKSGNIHGRSIGAKYRFGPFLFVNLQVSVFLFSVFFYFLFSTKDGAMYLSFLLLIANHLRRSYFVLVWSQTACHELK